MVQTFNLDPKVGGALDAVGLDISRCPFERIMLLCASRPRQHRLMLSRIFVPKCLVKFSFCVRAARPHVQAAASRHQQLCACPSPKWYWHHTCVGQVLVASLSVGPESASWDPRSQASAAAQQAGHRRVNQHFARGCSSNVGGRLSRLQLRSCRGGCPCLTN